MRKVQSVKQGFKFAVHVWGYHLIAALIGILFISTMSGVLGIIVNSLLIAGVVGIALNEGSYQGEKAATAAATIEKQEKEGRRVSELQKKAVFKRSVAVWAIILGCLPFLLLSGVNMIDAQKAPVTAEQQDTEIVLNYEGEAVASGLSTTPVNTAARMVFSSYIAFYALVDAGTLNVLFFVFSLPVGLAMGIGYLFGPRMRNRKLYDIAKGKKRKQRNLKVHKKSRGGPVI
jgi:hypothetical protein